MRPKIHWVTPATTNDSLDCIGPSVLREQGYEVFCVAQGQPVADPACVLVVRVDLMADATGLWRALCGGAQPAILVVRDAAQSARVIEILDKDTDGLKDIVGANDVREQLVWRVQRLAHVLRRQKESFDQLYRDSLTGALNRRWLDAQAEAVIREHDASGGALGVLLLDIDFFKRLNDRYGHQVGDQILVGMTTRLGEWFAPGDSIVRYGGEEFLVLLRRYDVLGVVGDAGRFVERFCQTPLALGDTGLGQRTGLAPTDTDIVRWDGLPSSSAQSELVSIGISGGLAFYQPTTTSFDDALRRADVALYRAKSEGRGRLVVDHELADVLAREGKDLRIDHFENVTRVVTERVTNLITLMGRRLMSEATRDAYQDALTGLHNRRYLDQHLERELEASRRNNRALSMVFMDLDHFHDINMTYGWPTGDEVLRAFARVLEGSVRTIDWSARYGGEEFCLVLPDTELAAATEVAERIRKNTQELSVLSSDGRPVSVTVSVGVVQRADETVPRPLLDRVATATKTAKEAGRNRIVTG